MNALQAPIDLRGNPSCRASTRLQPQGHGLRLQASRSEPTTDGSFEHCVVPVSLNTLGAMRFANDNMSIPPSRLGWIPEEETAPSLSGFGRGRDLSS